MDSLLLEALVPGEKQCPGVTALVSGAGLGGWARASVSLTQGLEQSGGRQGRWRVLPVVPPGACHPCPGGPSWLPALAGWEMRVFLAAVT